MASVKPEFGGHGLPSNPSDALRARRMHSSTAAGLPRPFDLSGAKDTSPGKIVLSRPQHGTFSSRSARFSPAADSTSPIPSLPSSYAAQSIQPRRMPSIGFTGIASFTRSCGSPDSSSALYYDNSFKSPSQQPETRSFRSREANSATSPAVQSVTSLDQAVDIYLDVTTRTYHTDFSTSTNSVDSNPPQSKSTAIYPELDRYRNYEGQLPLRPRKLSTEGLYKLSTHDLPPPTPSSMALSGNSSQLSMFSASPSTKFSASPGPGPYSRDTTPTSISSQSPSLMASSRPGCYAKPKQQSLAYSRPPVTRRRAASISHDGDGVMAEPPGLDVVRESITSSSSNSTVKENEGATRSKRWPETTAYSPGPSRRNSQKSNKYDSNATQGKPSDVNTAARPTLAETAPQKSAIPLRPSRKGTPDLKSQLFDPVPVIQSNIRTSRPTLRDSKGSGSTVHTRKLSSPTKPTKSSLLSHPLADAVRNRPSKQTAIAIGTQATKSISSVKSSASRFNFFARKKSSAEEDNKKTQPKSPKSPKTTRKGPAAGTGHEGYGKVGALRGKNGSNNLTYKFSGPQASLETIASDDSFLADRINPVVISGGSVVENRNKSFEMSRGDSKSSPLCRTSSESQIAIGAKSCQESNRLGLLQPSPLLYRDKHNLNSSDSEDGMARPTLALRRSIQGLQNAPNGPLRLPQPINTTTDVIGSPLTSIDTVLSDESQWELRRGMSQDSTASQQTQGKLDKKPRRSPRKWNFFGKSKKPARCEQTTMTNATMTTSAAVAATVTTVERRPVAFYAIMDASEVGESSKTNGHEVNDVHVSTPHTQASSFEMQWSLPLDSPPNKSLPNLPKPAGPPMSPPKEDTNSRPVLRPSRLRQVGRIPKVVPQYHNPTWPKSFSRPFGDGLQQPPYDRTPDDAESSAIGPKPTINLTALSVLTSEGGNNSGKSTTSPETSYNSDKSITLPEISYNTGIFGACSHGEFLCFSPRKTSVGTVYTSSNSSAYGTFASATAIIPKPDDPPEEDEIWDEYNDLLGDDFERSRRSATSSRGVPFHLERYQEKLVEEARLDSLAAKEMTCMSDQSYAGHCNGGMTERLATTFESSSTSFGTRNRGIWLERSSIEGESRHSISAETRFSCSSVCSVEYSSALAQVNLRVGSMTVSKWLTFGHVLFSDIRHELAAVKGESRRHAILVIDGLGNDDWSFYAAETYPQADFYNLSPRAPVAASPKLLGEKNRRLSSPTNHRQVQYVDHLEEFPFAAQSFDSVVYRFPVAAPEAHYGNIVRESRRVLRPEGHLELAVLDLDLNNMGDRGRRRVRGLREMLRKRDATTSLGSTADTLVRLLGQNGFSGIRAAKVGIPVASVLGQRNSGGCGMARMGSGAVTAGPRSLSDMMKEDGPTADANITKMVARVGRWWYTRCYENAIRGEGSIWDDGALLEECRGMGTSLKLMVCCARTDADVELR